MIVNVLTNKVHKVYKYHFEHLQKLFLHFFDYVILNLSYFYRTLIIGNFIYLNFYLKEIIKF